MTHWTCPNCRGEFPVDGPTLRDQFAMAALTGQMGRTTEYLVKMAYEIADAMLKEREKPCPSTTSAS